MPGRNVTLHFQMSRGSTRRIGSEGLSCPATNQSNGAIERWSKSPKHFDDSNETCTWNDHKSLFNTDKQGRKIAYTRTEPVVSIAVQDQTRYKDSILERNKLNHKVNQKDFAYCLLIV